MSIPKYHEIMPLVLDHLDRNGVQYWRDLEEPLAQRFELSEEEVSQEYDSGNGTIFLDRVSWAISYLKLAQLIERPRRSHYQITELGKDFLGKDSEIKELVKQKRLERRASKRAKKSDTSDSFSETTSGDTTPHEDLSQAYEDIRNSVCDFILDTILSKAPIEFEKLVVKLLDKMGYGGKVENAGIVTQASNDGGIDGIIKEDILGLGRVHIQAKRYKRDNTIGREDVQKFVGALAVAQSNKGVFITTSSYSKQAIEYAENLNGTTNVVLIDGLRLSQYIYDFGLGMQTEQTVTIKRMDGEFWENMQNDEKSK